MLKNSTTTKVSLQHAITQVDVADDLDQDGFVVIYEQGVQFKIQLAEQEYPNLEHLLVRVLVQGGDQSLSLMRIEITSEGDLFLHFVHEYSTCPYIYLQGQRGRLPADQGRTADHLFLH